METLKVDWHELEVNQYRGTVLSQIKRSQGATKHEFWLKLEDGLERSFQVYGFDIALREGQDITVCYAGSPGKSNYQPMLVVNHSAGETWQLVNTNTTGKMGLSGLQSPLGLLLGMSGVAILGIYSGIQASSVGVFFAFGFLGIPAFLLVAGIHEYRRFKTIKNYFSEKAKSLIKT
ncbi:hypothetical protein [Agarivorans gilvus]|uniref:Uncharacterized protein n=1 Tax=Agarivorans gilvus TaxID=680279 RepID=A0ABQ1I2K4_9ALTE|nr:hypothetical protein [Agarivorans gilvus]GGB05388.1 hypothetical protein GCM10007414_18400 [Agarivorans gilvus]